ncbi:MAG: oligosaccharide flippase family protein [Candidatus Eremiobacteraeota bacterium]|nr:oligosaccharide flippase family protein [Candidatus Eremiobacteraeota bacterium]
MRVKFEFGGVLQRLARSEFIRHGLLVFGASQIVNVFGYLFHFVMLRKLGVVSYGALSSLFAGLTVASVPATILTMIVVKFAAEFNAVGDLPKVKRLYQQMLLGTALCAVLIFLVAWIARGVIAGYLHIAQSGPIMATAAILSFYIMLPSARAVLQGIEDFRNFAISTALEGAGKAILGIGFVVAGFGLTGAISGYAAASCVALLYAIGAVRAHVRELPRVMLLLDVRRIVLTTAGVAAGILGVAILGQLDILLVKHFFSGRDAGIYGATSVVARMLFFLVAFIPQVLLPKAISRAVSGRSPRRLLAYAAGLTGLLSGLGLVVFALFAHLLISTMASAQFIDAAAYVFRYGIAMTILAALTLVTTYKIGLHRFDFVVPLALGVIGEIVAINWWHASLLQVITIVTIGHAAVLLASLYRIGRPVRFLASAEVPLASRSAG